MSVCVGTMSVFTRSYKLSLGPGSWHTRRMSTPSGLNLHTVGLMYRISFISCRGLLCLNCRADKGRESKANTSILEWQHLSGPAPASLRLGLSVRTTKPKTLSGVCVFAQAVGQFVSVCFYKNGSDC